MNKANRHAITKEMREAIFDGLTLDEYLEGSNFKNISRSTAEERWNAAKLMTEDWDAWGLFILQTEVIPAFEAFKGFMEAIDTYYNEGCWSNKQLMNNLKIDEKTVKGLLNLVGA